MRLETEASLEKARQCLANADVELRNDLTNDASRNAYRASFHAAKALIFERTGNVIRRHEGVQREFQRLTHLDPAIDKNVPVFLSQAYNFKRIADYETGPDAIVPPERARVAVATAERFVTAVASLI